MLIEFIFFIYSWKQNWWHWILNLTLCGFLAVCFNLLNRILMTLSNAWYSLQNWSCDCMIEKKHKSVMKSSSWKQKELVFLVLYAVVFYALVIRRSLQLSHGTPVHPILSIVVFLFLLSLIFFSSADYYAKLYGLRPGWIFARHNVRNFSF